MNYTNGSPPSTSSPIPSDTNPMATTNLIANLQKDSLAAILSQNCYCISQMNTELPLTNHWYPRSNNPVLQPPRFTTGTSLPKYRLLDSQSFTKLNITITKETQKEITSGNFNTLVKFLLDLHKKFNSRVKPPLFRKSKKKKNLPIAKSTLTNYKYSKVTKKHKTF